MNKFCLSLRKSISILKALFIESKPISVFEKKKKEKNFIGF